MKKREAIIKSIGLMLVVFMMSFASCDTVSSCWICENPRNSNDWQQVCNAMSKNKLESYGYVCTQE